MTACDEEWTDIVGCWPPGPPHHCDVTLFAEHLVHRCVCGSMMFEPTAR